MEGLPQENLWHKKGVWKIPGDAPGPWRGSVAMEGSGKAPQRVLCFGALLWGAPLFWGSALGLFGGSLLGLCSWYSLVQAFSSALGQF